MRLVLDLLAKRDSSYLMQYHHQIQGLIYNLLKDSPYDNLHDKEGYKFFCFSNILPPGDLKAGDHRTLIISSPDPKFIHHLHAVITTRLTEIRIEEMRFDLQGAKMVELDFPSDRPISMITGTPIIVRIERDKMLQAGIAPKGLYSSVFWRTQYPISIFIEMLRKNLVSKYVEFHKTTSMEMPSDLFSAFQFKKQVSTRVKIRDAEQIVIGTVWVFEFKREVDRGFIRFCLDAGFGERNSIGFGFMNVTNK